ncbi:hypothetical protein GJR88_04725 [Dietzia sp. DQ12-45-1b]|nr:hypothetical protein GJR88_04725 [Dietzia sp. DQ12-45-1b]
MVVVVITAPRARCMVSVTDYRQPDHTAAVRASFAAPT